MGGGLVCGVREALGHNNSSSNGSSSTTGSKQPLVIYMPCIEVIERQREREGVRVWRCVDVVRAEGERGWWEGGVSYRV